VGKGQILAQQDLDQQVQQADFGGVLEAFNTYQDSKTEYHDEPG
jgi:hypothetical protein